MPIDGFLYIREVNHTTVRNVHPQETASLAKLIRLAIDDIAHQLTGTTNETDVLERLEMFIGMEGNRFSSSCILVKEIEGMPIGMVLCYHGSEASQLYAPIVEQLKAWTPDTSPLIDQESDEDEYYIDAIAVNFSYQGRGYSKELIAAAERRAVQLNYDKIALNVDQSNVKAQFLYEKLGYKTDKEVIIHRKPYWHMVKFLP
jgi:ribosomal protein S18 acetylase RimI-like enzyme